MTRKMMPTPAQRRVLEALRDGARVDCGHLVVGIAELRPVLSVTLDAMDRAGWIAWTGSGRGTWYEITPLGRDALTQVEGRVG